MEKADNVCVRFTSKNYAAWSFQMEIYLKGKNLWSHVDGSDKGNLGAEGSDKGDSGAESSASAANAASAKAVWATKDAL